MALLPVPSPPPFLTPSPAAVDQAIRESKRSSIVDLFGSQPGSQLSCSICLEVCMMHNEEEEQPDVLQRWRARR